MGAVGSHDSAIGVETAEAGVPGFNTIDPDIMRGVDAIQGLWLATDAAENAMERVSDNSDAVLFVNQINALFHAQPRWNKTFNKEGEEVPIAGRDLFSNDKVKAILSASIVVIAPCPQVTRSQRAIYVIMIG